MQVDTPASLAVHVARSDGMMRESEDAAMNKAFVREPEEDGRAYCPRCRSLGVPVMSGPLDTHIRPESRGKLRHDAWFCSFPRCDVAYFNEFDTVVTVDELRGSQRPDLRVLRPDVRRRCSRRRRWRADATSSTLCQVAIGRGSLRNAGREWAIVHGGGTGVVHAHASASGDRLTARIPR